MGRAIVLVVLLTACGRATAPPASATSSPPSTTTTTTIAAESATARPSDEQISLFVANLVETLGSTGYVSAVEEDPLPFVTTGALMCQLLDEGSTPTEVLGQFLESFGPEAGDEDSALAGALLGSAVNVFCPQYRQLLTDDLG